MQSVIVCLKENVEITFYLERKLKRVVFLLQVKDLMQIIVKIRTKKILCMFLS